MPVAPSSTPAMSRIHLHVNAQTCRGFFRGDASQTAAGGPNYADWKASLTPRDERAAAALASVEMLRHGITAFVEPGSAFEPDAVAEAAKAVGIRCSLADPYMWDSAELMHALPGLGSKALFARVPLDRSRCLRILGGQLFRNRDTDGIIHGHVALYGEGTASDELYREAKALADREGVICHSHLGFDLDLAAALEAKWGRARLRYLEDLGVLGPNTTLVHMNLIRDEEVDPILRSGLSIVWCPLAYVVRGTPLRQPTRIPALKKRGANGAGERLPPASAPRATREGSWRCSWPAGPTMPPRPRTSWEMLTVGGARAAGLQHLVGSIEPGRRADLVIRSLRAAELVPGVDPVHQLVAVGHGPTADTVLVNGRIVMRQGRAERVDEEAVYAEARASVREVAGRLGLSPPGLWPHSP